jgi:hypothetical protein
MTSTLCLLLPLVALSIALDLFFVTGMRRLRKLKAEAVAKNLTISRQELWGQAFFPPAYKKEWQKFFIRHPQFHEKLGVILELTLLVAWALILGGEYLDMDPNVTPGGNEFGSAVQSHHFWTQVEKCGLCALWNGFERGGYPAFAEIQGSMLHPVVAMSTLFWGVVNGVKVSLIVALWCAGLAQWWMARELKLGWLPRMWSAGIAMAGGHLSGRMELGVFGVMLSTAMGSLVFAGILHLENARSGRAAVLLAIVASLAILSGQGYMQVGLIGILPAILIFLVQKDRKIAPHWRYYLLALLLALLLTAPLLVPLTHFGSNIVKDMDAEFRSAQPLPYFALNLVIDDVLYLRSNLLGKFPYPYLYSLYIGWVPVALAVFGLAYIPRSKQRVFGFLITGIILTFLIASAVILKPLVKIWPSVAGIRHSPQIAGLAIPLILALSAYGLEKLMNLRWPSLFMVSPGPDKQQNQLLSLRWIILIPLFLGLRSCYEFSRIWLYTIHQDNDLSAILAILKTESLQWVEPPFGEHAFIEPALGMGLKLSPGIMTWSWRKRESPAAFLYVSRKGIPPGNVKRLGAIKGLAIYKNDDSEYATVQAGEDLYPCKAYGSGGFIQVNCEANEPGTLTVKEYSWSGWRVWMDGKVVGLEFDSAWLKVPAPAGKHTYVFRYLPWDVPLGFILFICGLIACASLWRQQNHFETGK